MMFDFILSNDSVSINLIVLLILVIAFAYAFTTLSYLTNDFRKCGIILGGGRPKKTNKNFELKNLDEFPDSKFEKQVRAVFQRITQKKFPSVYPGWLKYKETVMELDGYSPDLDLAFEAQGPQHTNWIKSYDPDYDSYLRRLDRDEAKVRICKEKEVGLIIVDFKVPKHMLGSYIRSRIYDIAVQWECSGLHHKVKKLGTLAFKSGDYIEDTYKTKPYRR